MNLPGTLSHSPAAERNGHAILARLKQLLPAQGRALEVASGTGQHVALFGANLPGWIWQASDLHDHDFQAICQWCALAGVAQVRSPCLLDVLSPRWPTAGAAFEQPFDLIYCANMLHIAPWACCQGLMQGAARHLASTGRLLTYGPYFEHGVASAASNLAFDNSLRERDRAWGIRWLHEVVAQAELAGLRLASRIDMPANNLLLVFERASLASGFAGAEARG